MSRRLKNLMKLPTDRDKLIEMCREKGLNGYETEIILRIYWKKQSLTYISYNILEETKPNIHILQYGFYQIW